MTLKEIESLRKLSELLKQQADIGTLKLLVKKNSNVLINLSMAIDGNMGSVSIAGLSPNQTLDMLNYISSVNENTISEFKKIQMDRSKMAVTTALIIVICVLALIFIIPYVCFLINFWLGLIVTILFVLGISLRLFSSHLKKEENKVEK